ncbi:MAG: hypothetical protein VYD64_06155, partial [Pseudomonadota bacterium]|nr:hypothetical protein [Pseudomonadota bacterium]
QKRFQDAITGMPSETQINRRVANAFGEVGRAAGEAFKVRFSETVDISDSLKEMASQAMEGLTALADATNQDVQDAKDAMANSANYVADRFEQFFDGIRNGESAWQSLRDVALGVLQDIASALMRSSILKMIGGIFGDSVQAPLQTGMSFPGFANGTRSAPGGLAWVGERGEELAGLPGRTR